MTRVAWPEAVPATFQALSTQDSGLHETRHVLSSPLLMLPSVLDILSSGLKDLNVRISDTLNVDIGMREYATLESSNVTAHPHWHPESQKMSLNVDWQEFTVDHLRESGLGLSLFEALFSLLTEKDQRHLSSARPISHFTNISISVPTVVNDRHVNENSPRQRPGSGNEGYIQLFHAFSLTEFSWSGQFTFLTSKFRHIPFLRLTVLKVSDCLISLKDALSLLNACPLLTSVTLDTIHDVQESGQILFGLRELPNIVLAWLDYLSIASNVPLAPLFESLEWGETLRKFVLLLKEGGINDITTYSTAYASHFRSIGSLIIWGNSITQNDMNGLLDCVQTLELNGHKLSL